MTEFTVVVLRFAFFVALWLFVFLVASVLNRDIFGPRRTRAQRRAGKMARKAASRNSGAQSSGYGSAGGAGYGSPSGRGSAGQAPGPVHELVVTAGPLVGNVVALGTAPITLGRSADNTLVLDDDFASAHHARIAPDGSGGWYIEDLGSTNGTYIGNERLSAATVLGANTAVTIGNTVVELRS